jgi:hypothetical protein
LVDGDSAREEEEVGMQLPVKLAGREPQGGGEREFWTKVY